MRQYVIDAFTDHVFAGNPAAVNANGTNVTSRKMRRGVRPQ